MSPLEQRLTKLEKECRLHRMFWGGLVLILCTLALWGATKPIPEVIQARRFEVINEQGKSSAVLAEDEEGGYVSVRDPQGKAKGTFALDEGGHGYLRLDDNAGKERATIGVSTTGSGGVWITDSAGREIETLSSLHRIDRAVRHAQPAQDAQGGGAASFLSTAIDVIRFVKAFE